MKTVVCIFATLFILFVFYGKSLPSIGEDKNSTDVSLDINNIQAQYSNFGVMFGNLEGDTIYPGFEWPTGEDKYAIGIGGPWIAGKVNGQLRVALVESTATFQPGKMFDDGSWDNPQNPRYRIYKSDYGDGIPSEAIQDGAPDSVWGDQMLWCVFNDADSNLHSGKFQIEPLGVEIQLTAFAYQSGFQGAENTVFNRWVIVNKSNDLIDEMYFAFWFDPLIGGAVNQRAGCDSTLNMGYAYSAVEQDSQYGGPPPAVGCVLLQGPVVSSPSDTAIQFGQKILDFRNLKLKSFIAYRNNYTNIGVPRSAYEIYNYMTSRLRDGSAIWFPGPDPKLSTDYMYLGDPVFQTGWNDNDPANKKLVISTGPFKLSDGEVQEIIFATMIAQGNSRLNSVTELKNIATTVKNISFPIPASIKSAIKDFNLYQNFPNPFNPSTTIRFELIHANEISLEIFDVLGRKLITLDKGFYTKGRYNRTWNGRDETGRQIASGVYIYHLKAGDQTISKKMLLLR